MSIDKKQVLIVALAMFPSLAGAQSPPQSSSSSAAPSAVAPAPHTVTFVLVPSLEVDTAGTIILRRAVRAPQNVILVSEKTTPADVVEAIAMLNRSRRSRGDSLTTDMKAITRRGNDAIARSSRSYDSAVRNLERLRIALAIPVDGVGTFPAVTATLPPARRESR